MPTVLNRKVKSVSLRSLQHQVNGFRFRSILLTFLHSQRWWITGLYQKNKGQTFQQSFQHKYLIFNCILLVFYLSITC